MAKTKPSFLTGAAPDREREGRRMTIGTPKRDPYPPKLSATQRKDYLTRAQRGDLSPDEVSVVREDYERAIAKKAAAQTEARNPGEPLLRRFDNPDEQASSASATVTSMLLTVEGYWKDGARKRQSRRRAIVISTAARKDEGKKTVVRIRKQWELLASWTPSHNRASKIARTLDLSPGYVRKVIRKENLS